MKNSKFACAYMPNLLPSSVFSSKKVFKLVCYQQLHQDETPKERVFFCDAKKVLLLYEKKAWINIFHGFVYISISPLSLFSMCLVLFIQIKEDAALVCDLRHS